MKRQMQMAVLLLCTLLVVGGVVALVPGGTTTASTTGTIQPDVTTIEGSSENGVVDDVSVTLSGNIEWENLPADAENVTVAFKLVDADRTPYENFPKPIEVNETIPIEGGQNGEYAFETVTFSLTGSGLYSAQRFSAWEDNTTAYNEVPGEVIVTVTGADGTSTSYAEQHTVRVAVQNLRNSEASAVGEVSVDPTLTLNRDADDSASPGNGDLGRSPGTYTPTSSD